MIVSVAVAPMRVTPSAMTSSKRVQRPHAARGLDPDVRRRVRAHQAQVVMGGARRGEARAGLDEVAARCLGEPAGADLLVIGEVGVLEDHLDDRPGGVGYLHDRPDVVLDLLVPARLEGADLEDHVQLRGAVREGPARLEHLGLRGVVAVREPDGRPDLDVGPVEDRLRARHVRGAHTHGRDVVLGRQAAAGLHEGIVQLRPQQAVVDGLRDVALGEVRDAACHGAPAWGVDYLQ